MSSIFTKIIKGEIPSYKIAEDDKYYAFLDINPNALGHTLCIPKKEVDKLLDLDEETYLGLMAFSRKIGLAIEASVPCNRVGLTVIGSPCTRAFNPLKRHAGCHLPAQGVTWPHGFCGNS